MGWIALIGCVFQFLTELIKLIKEVRDDSKQENADSKKQKTEHLQSALRGIVDHDASRIVASIDALRRLRTGK